MLSRILEILFFGNNFSRTSEIKLRTMTSAKRIKIMVKKGSPKIAPTTNNEDIRMNNMIKLISFFEAMEKEEEKKF
jgi:hypothetical protein